MTAVITMSPAAAAHAKKFAALHGVPCSMRVGVRTAHCSAYAYTCDLDDCTRADDTTYTCHGVRILVDPKSLVYLAGTHIDYRREGLQAGFQFANPNMRGTCGCGDSFTV